jgi:hypothetical protein
MFYLHIPRTGGTWLGKAAIAVKLRQASRYSVACSRSRSAGICKHYPLCEYEDDFLDKIDFSFTFVRHPVPYYESAWRWMMSNRRQSRNKWGLVFPWNVPVRHFNFDFNVWVAQMLQHEPGWVSRMYETYCGRPGSEILDFVGRTETLAKDFATVLDRVGCKYRRYRLAYMATTRINSLEQPFVWDPKLKQQVIQTERPAIERFYETSS